jgi:hypothetical protein
MQNYGRHQMTASDADSNSEVTSLSVRVTLLTIFIFGALALLLIPVSNFPGPQMPGFIPLFVAGIFFAQLPTAFFLILWFRRQCRWSLLLLGCTYFYSALMSLSHLLTFPGAILVGLHLSFRVAGVVKWLLGPSHRPAPLALQVLRLPRTAEWCDAREAGQFFGSVHGGTAIQPSGFHRGDGKPALPGLS